MKRTARREKPQSPNEVVIEINLDANGSFFVECLAEHIVNQVAASGALRQTIKEAVESAQVGDAKPAVIRLHLALDEMLPVK